METFLKGVTAASTAEAEKTKTVPIQFEEEINAMHTALQLNKGVMPSAWVPYANMLIAVLTMLNPYYPENVKAIILVLIAAIQAAE